MNGKADEYKSKRLPPLLPKTSRAAQYHEQVFLSTLRDRLEQLNRLPLTVFVCGPSEESNPVTKKKLDTVNELRSLGHNALIGEEIVQQLKDKDKSDGRPLRPDNIYEIEVARASDLVVIFRASPGAVAEFHEFQAVPEIAAKTLVFADKAHEASYSSAGALTMHDKLYGKVEFYTSPDDLDKCLLKERVIRVVEFYQAAKWLRELGVSR